jgi:N-acetylglucosamine kinase-like BadF-type ATPase
MQSSQPTCNYSKLVLGVDGGGTKTKAWLAAIGSDDTTPLPRLDVVGRGQAGPSNPRSVGFDVAFANLDAAINAAVLEASALSRSIDFACLSLAGAGRPEEQAKLVEWANHRNLASKTIVMDDVEPLALAAEYEQQLANEFNLVDAHQSWNQSITLVAGTGSIACGVNERGQRVRVGGWGYLLGDAGSGFAIGLAGLQAICHAHDGTGAKTDLSAAMLNELEFDAPTQLVSFMYQSPIPRDSVAQLASVVIEYASRDSVAEGIVESAIGSLTDLISGVASRLELLQRGYSLALSGGVLSHHPNLMERLLGNLDQRRLVPQSSHLIEQPTYGPLVLSAMRVK